MMRYQFIRDHEDQYPITLIADVLGVSRSGYYDWYDRPMSERATKHLEMCKQVRDTFDEYDEIYGSRKITEDLEERNIEIAVNTVAKMMQEMSLKSRAQKHRVYKVTTDSDHDDPIEPNKLNRDFEASKPNEKWVADITYVRTNEGFSYMAGVMDLYSRKIVGWAVSDSLGASLVLDAMHQALKTRCPGKDLMHHSDRGSQYTSDEFRSLLTARKIKCSMSRKGNCWDNACMERFMGVYKHEWMNHYKFETTASVRQSTFEYIELFYNRKRKHQALGYVSPCVYELKSRGNEAA